jgi:hypothetical protein
VILFYYCGRSDLLYCTMFYNVYFLIVMLYIINNEFWISGCRTSLCGDIRQCVCACVTEYNKIIEVFIVQFDSYVVSFRFLSV